MQQFQYILYSHNTMHCTTIKCVGSIQVHVCTIGTVYFTCEHVYIEYRGTVRDNGVNCNCAWNVVP